MFCQVLGSSAAKLASRLEKKRKFAERDVDIPAQVALPVPIPNKTISDLQAAAGKVATLSLWHPPLSWCLLTSFVLLLIRLSSITSYNRPQESWLQLREKWRGRQRCFKKRLQASMRQSFCNNRDAQTVVLVEGEKATRVADQKTTATRSNASSRRKTPPHWTLKHASRST